MSPGATTWQRIVTEEYQVEAVTDPFVVAVLNGRVQVFRLTQEGVAPVGELPSYRFPVKIATQGTTVRVLTHPRDPGELGFFWVVSVELCCVVLMVAHRGRL